MVIPSEQFSSESFSCSIHECRCFVKCRCEEVASFARQPTAITPSWMRECIQLSAAAAAAAATAAATAKIFLWWCDAPCLSPTTVQESQPLARLHPSSHLPAPRPSRPLSHSASAPLSSPLTPTSISSPLSGGRAVALRGAGGRRAADQRGDAAEAAAAGAGGVARGVGAVLGVGRVRGARGAGGVPAPAAAARSLKARPSRADQLEGQAPVRVACPSRLSESPVRVACPALEPPRPHAAPDVFWRVKFWMREAAGS
jgi:hypothetical protein